MKTGNFTHSMRRNKCRIYLIYSTWNLTKIKRTSFRNERRKGFGMFFEEQIPWFQENLRIIWISRMLVNFNSLSRETGGRPIWSGYNLSTVESQEILCVVLMAEYHSYINHSRAGSHNFPPTYFPTYSNRHFQSFRPVFERHVKINPFPRTDSTWPKSAKNITIFQQQNSPPRDTPHFS